MAEYCFPAIIEPDETGYSVSFPDLENCFTCGDTLADAVYMAADALALVLTDMEDEKATIPAPADVRSIQADGDALVTLVAADTTAYRRRTGSKAVKKTLTIPQWLNEAAEQQNLNFSQTLQDALMKKLNVS